MRILLLNQYFPPDPAPTGILLGELAERLRAEGHTVEFIDAGAEYRGGQQQGGRMRREAAALGRMFLTGLRARRPEVVLSASSPPCLLVAATFIALRHGARSIHWAMDLYPELAVALGEIKPSLLSRTIATVMGWCYRQTNRVVALDEDMAAHLQRTYGVQTEICRPWVFAPVLDRLQEALASSPAPAEPWTWVYSGNLGRAHEWETLLAAQQIIEGNDRTIRLLFQGGGPSWPAAQARAAELGLQRCSWSTYVSEAELPSALLQSVIGVATQRPEAQGLLWPSKLGLLLALPRGLLWVGRTDGAIAEQLRSLPHAGIFAPGEAEAIAQWILAEKARGGSPAPAEQPRTRRAAALDWWARLVEDLSDRSR